MPSINAKESIWRSTTALQSGNLEEAKRHAEIAIELDAGSAEAFSLYGVILTRTREDEAATDAFRKAFMLQPNEARHSYNLAAHLYARGDEQGAADMLRQSLNASPGNMMAGSLKDRMAKPRTQEPVELDLPGIVEHQGEAVESQDAHALKFMRDMEVPWTATGWAFVILGYIVVLMLIVFNPFVLPVGQGADAGLPTLSPKPSGIVTMFLWVMSGVLSFFWMLVDVVDRKMKLVWLVPMVACCSCGFYAAPHTLYMLMRRK